MIDRSIGLNELVLRQGFHSAMDAADDAGGNAAGESEGVAYGEYFFSDFHLVTVANFDRGQWTSCINFQDGKIGSATGSKQLAFVGCAIGECNIDLVRVLNNVPVRNDEPARGQRSASPNELYHVIGVG